MTDKKESAFFQAIKKLYFKVKPALWRAEYRIVHRMRDQYDMSEIPAAWNLIKLGLLAYPHGKRFKRNANKIRKNMFDAIIDNNDELLIWNFHLATLEERMEFAQNTLMTMHNKISAKEPDIRPALKRVTKQPMSRKQKRQKLLGMYYGRSGKIAMTELGLSRELCAMADTMAHEYTHALQNVLRSALPTDVMKFINRHPRGYKWTPYLLRPDETEAWAAGNRVGKNFEDKFDKYYWENVRD